MIKHFSNILKIASVKDEYLKDSFNKQYASFKRDANKKEINSFGEGFAAGAALPTLLSLASSGMLNPRTHERSNKFKERVYHGSLAFQQAGLKKEKAKELATALERSINTSGARAATGQSLNNSLQQGIKSLVVQQVSGAAPLTKGIQDLTADVGGFFGIGSKVESVKQFRGGLERAVPDAKARVEIASGFADEVIKRNFPQIANNSASIISDSQYSDILDVGKGIAKLKGKQFSGRKATLKRLSRFVKGNALTPLIIGLVGGSAAVTQTRAKKKYKKDLERRANAKR